MAKALNDKLTREIDPASKSYVGPKHIHRDGIHYSWFNAYGLDAGIAHRQYRAVQWRKLLLGMGGAITSRKASKYFHKRTCNLAFVQEGESPPPRKGWSQPDKDWKRLGPARIYFVDGREVLAVDRLGYYELDKLNGKTVYAHR